jgi:cytochrome o ubiquinol oxidase subunit 2
MSAQFSGEGFADMYFNVEAVAPEKFSEWVDSARNVGTDLNTTTYAQLAKPSAAVSPFTYRSVAPGLFDSIRGSEMHSGGGMSDANPTSMRAEK